MKGGVFVILIIISIIITYMYSTGAIYINKLQKCKGRQGFCGIQQFVYQFPSNINSSLYEMIEDDKLQKRVNIRGWKAGKTIPCSIIEKQSPAVIKWYFDFAREMSAIVGENLITTPLNLPTSCCILIYDKEDDFINWHFDVNYFDGRFFTVLLPITNDATCTKFVYKNNDERDTVVDIRNNNSVIFEGSEVFHMASKLCSGQKRAILSLQYTTNDNINLLNRTFMHFKDMAYV